MKAPTGPILAAIVAVLSIAALGLLEVAHTSAQTPPQAVANYIVVLRDNVPNTDGEVDNIERGQRFRARLRFRNALKGFAATLTPAQVQSIQRLPWVDFVTPDYEVQIAGSVEMWSGDEAPPGTRRIESATSTTVRQASNVNVAILDTGVDLSHPDLNVVDGTNCVSPGATAQDDNGHGTHTAGTVGARNNGGGVVGVAPDTRLYAVKVLNSQGSGYWSQVICGIDWVTANAASLNIKVANMSISGGGSNDNNCGNSNNDALHLAVCRVRDAGVTIVAAAGNSNADFAGAVPAAYPEVLTVTAMTDTDGAGGATGGAPACRSGEADDRYASFSSYAVSATEQAHTIAAPGVCVLSTYVTYTTSGSWWRRTTTTNHTYSTISGTSMATPHVAGSVALCFGDGGAPGPCTGMTPAQVIEKMRADAQARSNASDSYGFSGDPENPVTGKYYGYLVSNAAPAPPAPDFSITASPSSRSVTAGSGTTYDVTVTGLNEYVTPVDLSVAIEGAPTGVSASFTTDPVTPDSDGATSTLSISTTSATPAASYTLTITGTDGTLTHQTSVTLDVVVADFTLAATPSSQTITVGDPTSYTVTVTGVNGYSTPVDLTVSSLPAGATGTFNPSSVTPNPFGATSTLNIPASTPPGTYPLTITGTSGSLVHTTSVTLVVDPVPQGDFSMTASPTSRTLIRFFGQTSTTYTVTLQAIDGYSAPVALSVTSGLAAGMTASFSPISPTPTAGGVTSTMQLNVNNSTPRGSRTLTITGVGSDGTTHSVNVSVSVY